MVLVLDAGSACILACGGGVLSHLAYFKHGEHHMYGMHYAQLLTAFNTLSVFFLVRVAQYSLLSAVALMSAVSGAWIAGVFGSLFVYRGFLHPLNKFPGPFLARFTSFWYSSQTAGNAQAHRLLVRLHEKYGPYVRIGPGDLSIIDPKAPQLIYGLGSKCTKGAWYDLDTPAISMHTTRDRQLHDMRRRVWAPAFSDKALRGYEERIRGYGNKLVEQLRGSNGKPVNVSDWFNYYSFDVMGDLAFGESFKMLDTGEHHDAIKLLNAGMEPLHFMFPPWLYRVLFSIPGAAKEYHAFIKYCADQLDRRWRNEPNVPDIFSALIEPFRKSGKPQGDELSQVQADARLIIVAGSDTTAATMTHLFYSLAKNPEYFKRLREELEPWVTPEGDVENRDLIDRPLLNGCINETLRLFPPVPSAVQRKTPPEGIHVGETYIPGNMTVWCPQYVLGRNEMAYKDAKKFYPERWSSDSDAIIVKNAFAPFSMGPYGCIGKPLALLELRTVATKVLMNFDIEFAQGENGSNLTEQTRDHFTVGLGDLNLRFSSRQAK